MKKEVKKEISYKILLLGDSSVGKTCFITRYVNNTFEELHLGTIGLDYKFKNVMLDDGQEVKVQIWDTAGQDRFHSVTKNYYKGAQGIILIYDVTKQDTFDNVEHWIEQIKEEVSEKVCIILVGNKIDLDDERIITYEDGNKIAQKYKLDFYECSAKTGANIENTFKELIKKIVQNYSKIKEKGTKLKSNNNDKKGCC